MTLHEFIILMIFPIGTSGYNEIQYIIYTSEYISKLQIHQHTYQQGGEYMFWVLSYTSYTKEFLLGFLPLKRFPG